MRRPGRGEHGAVLFTTFLMMLMLAGLALAAAVFSQNSLTTGRSQLLDKQAFFVAEAGWQRARQALIAGTWTAAASPGNVNTESFGAGQYRVTVVDNGGGTYTVTSEGFVPDQTAVGRARRQVVETALPVTSNDGSNFSLSATALSSGDASGSPASNAKDGSTSTRWEASSSGSGTWLAMDHGSATTLTKIVILEQSNRINALTIEHSDNGSTWTAAGGLSVIESPGDTWTATFTATSHRYFRAQFTDVSAAVRVREMQDYNSALSSLGAGAVTTTG